MNEQRTVDPYSLKLELGDTRVTSPLPEGLKADLDRQEQEDNITLQSAGLLAACIHRLQAVFTSLRALAAMPYDLVTDYLEAWRSRTIPKAMDVQATCILDEIIPLINPNARHWKFRVDTGVLKGKGLTLSFLDVTERGYGCSIAMITDKGVLREDPYVVVAASSDEILKFTRAIHNSTCGTALQVRLRLQKSPRDPAWGCYGVKSFEYSLTSTIPIPISAVVH